MKVRFAVAPEPGTMEDLLVFADALEASGFDGVWLPDAPMRPVLDPLVGLAAVAGRTTRLKLGANIVPLGRHPFLLAKALAQLDRVSGGRVLLAFVPGLGPPAEGELFGLGGTGRGALLEEVMALVRAWWVGEEVEHRSERWSFGPVAPAARPVQAPLEIWLGGRAPRALERAGRLADGWLGAQVTPVEAAAARVRIAEAAQAAGRVADPEHFGVSVPYCRTAPPPERRVGLAGRDDVEPGEIVPVGADELRALVERYRAAGLSKFVLRPGDPVASWDEEAAWLAEAVLDLQS